MAGIDKLIESLACDKDNKISEINANAEKQAEEILDKSAKEAESKAAAIISEAKKKAVEIVNLAEKTAEMKSRQASLQGRVNVLNNVLTDTLKYLNNLSEEEYFGVLKLLCINNAQPGDGKILLSGIDFDSLPSNFESSVNSAVSGSLKCEKSDFVKERGVILAYGEIEINLLFSKLISSNAEEIKSKAKDIIFS